MTPPPRRYHLRALLLFALLIGVGLFFYFERMQALLHSALPVPAMPQRLIRSLRESAQEAPETGHFLPAEHWSFLNQGSLKNWEEKVFKGGTVFQVMPGGKGGSYLHSESKDACSGLYVKTRQEATPDLWMSWSWRVLRFPDKKNERVLSGRNEDDYAARVYVIFLGKNLFRSDVIEYIWDKTLPAGTFADSPYSDRIKLLVLRSGEKAAGEGNDWKEERRNLYGDYRALFGRVPKHPVGLIALMSDSDNTASGAAADFGDIILKRKTGV